MVVLPKMSKSHKGIKHSDEAKRKIGDANRGIVRFDEYKLKMSKIKKGVGKNKEISDK